jgi:hypothetical protein
MFNIVYKCVQIVGQQCSTLVNIVKQCYRVPFSKASYLIFVCSSKMLSSQQMNLTSAAVPNYFISRFGKTRGGSYRRRNTREKGLLRF